MVLKDKAKNCYLFAVKLKQKKKFNGSTVFYFGFQLGLKFLLD